MRKLITLVSIFFLLSHELWATAQIPDIIIYNGDTLALYNCPLFSFPSRDIQNPRTLFGSKGCFFTACWRNYVATWEIIDNELFLTKIRNACYPTKMEKVAVSVKEVPRDSIGKEFADLKALFPDRYLNGKVKADWVDKILYAPFGKLIHYMYNGFDTTYEFEFKFVIKNGKLLAVEKLDNQKARRTVFSTKKDTLTKFLRSKIDWGRLPKLPKDSVVKVAVNFSADENGIVDNVKLVDSTKQNRFTEEAIRVVKMIPEWDVNFVHGQFIRPNINCQVEFIQPIENEEMQQLIAHDKNITAYSTDQKVKIIKTREKINDSIQVCYFKEYREKDSRNYKFNYIFIDYTPENKYIKNILLQKVTFMNDYVIMDAQKRKLMKHNHNISEKIAKEWFPITYYNGKFYSSESESNLSCLITDSIINCPQRYFDTYIIQDFNIKNKKHYTFKLTRFDANETLDLYFIDEKNNYALMKFRDKFQLFARQNEMEKFPIISYTYAKWVDIRDEFDKIESESKKLPKDVDTLKTFIRNSLKLSPKE